MPKTLIAVPHTGNIRAELATFLLSLKSPDTKILLSYGRPIDHNRNQIVKTFLESDMDRLLMIDSDIEPPANILEMEGDVCSALCHVPVGKEIFHTAIVKKDGGYERAKLEDGINEIDAIGTGCLMINRKVLEDIDKPTFRFRMTEEGLLELGEDFDFCERAKEKGFKITCNTHFKCNHYQIRNN